MYGIHQIRWFSANSMFSVTQPSKTLEGFNVRQCVPDCQADSENRLMATYAEFCHEITAEQTYTAQ